MKLYCLHFILVFYFLIYVEPGYAQEINIVPLSYNPVVAKKWEGIKSLPNFRMFPIADTLSLPFFDDFSEETVYPDPSLWMDKCVFINRDLPIAPINLGVATFEGLNKEGYPYNFSALPSSSQSADTLTSKPINMGSPFSPADSLYLSFYYQAKGRGDAPDNTTISPAGNDSLFLQFKKSSTGKWVTVWKKLAYAITSKDTNFHLVMVPITDTSFFKKGFQFRFRNYASPTGNLDHWHIDYVKLATRSFSDTIVKDVNFVYNAQSFLKGYHSMPWRQYHTNDMIDKSRIFIRNNDNIIRPVTYEYYIMNEMLTPTYSYNGGNINLNSYTASGYDNDPNHATPSVSANYSFPGSMTSNSDYRIYHIIKGVGDPDTLTFYQRFYNYFAYDDGTAEAAVFLSPQFSQLGYKFTLNTPDTLRSLSMFFNPLIKSASTLAFRIMIWKDQGGVPQPTGYFYMDSVVYPEYAKGHNKFVTYKLSNPSLVMPAGSYYIGYMQLQDQNFNSSIQLGLDLNTNSGDRLFYNVGSGWIQSNIKGSLMINPVFGDTMKIAGIRAASAIYDDYVIYPNPVSNMLRIVTAGQHEMIQLDLVDLLGRNVYSVLTNTSEEIDISIVPEGIYSIKITNSSKHIVCRKKILVVR